MQDNLDLLWLEYHPYILGFLKSQSGCTDEDAEDMASEVLLKAWTHAHKFEGRSHMRHWIKKIALNKYIDFLRRKKRVQFISMHENPTLSEDEDLWSDMEFEDSSLEEVYESLERESNERAS